MMKWCCASTPAACKRPTRRWCSAQAATVRVRAVPVLCGAVPAVTPGVSSFVSHRFPRACFGMGCIPVPVWDIPEAGPAQCKKYFLPPDSACTRGAEGEPVRAEPWPGPLSAITQPRLARCPLRGGGDCGPSQRVGGWHLVTLFSVSLRCQDLTRVRVNASLRDEADE